jgi:hypothetical protein
MATYCGWINSMLQSVLPWRAQWIGWLLGHENGLDVERWIGARCQCTTMNKNCMHKEHMSKVTLLGIRRYKFYERLILPTISYIEFKRHFRLPTSAPVRKICSEYLELAS